MAAKRTDEEKIAAAAVSAIRKSGWAQLTLSAVARQAKVPLATLADICPDKRALLALIVKPAATQFLDSAEPPDMSMSVRDRIFDSSLRWFEFLVPYRDIFQAVHDDRSGELASIIDVLPLVNDMAYWIVEMSGLPTTGWKSMVARRGLGVLLAETMMVWLKDGDELGKTMAHLDRRLRTIEEWLNTLQQARRNAAPD